MRPGFETVKVPPFSSSAVSFFARARLERSSIAAARPASESRSAWRTHRHDQALLGLDRDADVDVALLDDRVLEHRGVQRRELAQRAHRGVHDERQVGERHAVRLLEGALVLRRAPRATPPRSTSATVPTCGLVRFE